MDILLVTLFLVRILLPECIVFVSTSIKVIAAVNKMNEGDVKSSFEFKVNGTTDAAKIGASDLLEVELALTQGQTVTFEGFSYLGYMLQPEFFERVDGQYKFRAVRNLSTSYRSDREFIYVERTDKTNYPDAHGYRKWFRASQNRR